MNPSLRTIGKLILISCAIAVVILCTMAITVVLYATPGPF